MFDLYTGIDLDKVMSALLIDKEFGRPGITVVDGLGEFECVIEDTLSDRFLKVRSGCDLDHLRNFKMGKAKSIRTRLLMSPLD